jgi:hypothetical protein
MIKEELFMAKMTDGKNYLKIEEFAKMYGVKSETVIRRRNDIPGIEKIDNEWYALEGTRYPLKIKAFKIVSDYDRYYVLLRAIDEHKYISCEMLGIYQNEFDYMITCLLRLKYIYQNDSANSYGANRYTCTYDGTKVLKLEKRKVVKIIAEGLAKIVKIVVNGASSCAARVML